MATWSKNNAVRTLWMSVATITDDDEAMLVQAVANYVDSTAEHRSVDQRVLLTEVAMAYLEGYQHATANRAREAWAAIRSAGLTI